VIAAARVHARLAWLGLRRRKLLWILAGLLLLPALASGVLVAEGNGGRDLFDNMMQPYFFFLIPFVPALLLSSAVGDEVDGKTWTFVFARPAPRGAMLAGKWAAATAAATALTAAALALSFALAMTRLSDDFLPELLHFLRVEAAAMIGVAAFGALAAAIGTLFVRHPLVATLIYLGAVEATLGSAPLVVNVATLSWQLRNLADLGQPSNYGPSAHVPALLSLALLVSVPSALLALAGWKLRTAEY
jgi:ABC-type transport system involved in multi-copper enzyme maturation permease subunit